ncbi:MAG: VWA domain-containing protein [Euryarchaeota archaeon]|nr:VWA domain-containing protein [Euryarchaeota archaeon]
MKRLTAIFLALTMAIVLNPGTTQPAASSSDVCGPLDVAFLIDDTGSMGGALATVQTQAADLIADIDSSSGGDYQLALVTYKVRIEVDEDLRPKNGDTMYNKLNTLFASGGPGPNVNVNEAMNTAINRLPASGRDQSGDFNGVWRDSATKVIVIVTDAPPGGFDGRYTKGVDDVQARDLAYTAASLGIRISSVFVPTDGNYAGQKEMMQEWASITGGLFTQTDITGAGTGQALRDFIGECGGPGLCNTLANLPALTGDGLLEGLYGWAGHEYGFNLSEIVDPDGDPITVQWGWDDGITSTGLAAIRSFPPVDPLGIDPVALTLRVIEDVSAHCETVETVTQSLVFRFLVVPDLDVLLSLVQGLSCDVGETIGTRSDVARDYIAVLCDLKATVNTHGAPTDIVDEVRISQDGTTLASSSDPSLSYRYDALVVPDGAHDLEACATAVNDKYARSFCSTPYVYEDLDCTNLPPVLGTIRLQGMLDGTIGWADLPYGFTASLYDPDGDPLSVQWTWDDGTALSGASVARSFGLGQQVGGVLRVVEDTSRCPFFPGATIEKAIPTFKAVTDLVPSLVGLVEGVSCDVGALVPSWQDFDIVGVSCPVQAVVDLGTAPKGILGTASLRVDGATIGTSYGATQVGATYRASQVAAGFHELDACFTAAGDIHGRSFCTEPWSHYTMDCTNDLPVLKALSSDGMGRGLLGWAGLAYRFAATIDDEDPVLVEWVWDDGTSSIGPGVTQSFPLTGVHPFSIILMEDVSGRCPYAKTGTVVHGAQAGESGAFRFESLPDWSVAMDRPAPGWSCAQGTYLRSALWGDKDFLAGRCLVTANVDTHATIADPTMSGILKLDGNEIYQTKKALLQMMYDSIKHSLDEHSMEVCYMSPDDKYARGFCSGPYTYLNVGR